MTPLQLTAATKIASGQGVNSYKVTQLMDYYWSNPLVVAIRYGMENVFYSGSIFPLVSLAANFKAGAGIIQTGDINYTSKDGSTALVLPGFSTSSSVRDGYIAYADTVIGSEMGHFSSVVSRSNVAITNLQAVRTEITNTINGFDITAYGTTVENAADFATLGIAKFASELVSQIRDTSNGTLPTIDELPKTDTALIGTILTLQGPISGSPSSIHYGTIRGIYEQAVASNLSEVNVIHSKFIDDLGLGSSVGLAGIPYSLYNKIVRSNWTIEEATAFLNGVLADAKVLATASAEEEHQAASTLTSWATARLENVSEFIAQIRDTFIDILAKPEYYEVDSRFRSVLESSIWSEQKLQRAINRLPYDVARSLFTKLGSKIVISKLNKYTDILDLAQCALALPGPLTNSTASTVIKSTISTDASKLGDISNTQTLSVDRPKPQSITDDDSLEAITNYARQAVRQIKADSTPPKVERTFTSLYNVKINLERIKGFSNIQSSKELGNLLRTFETTLPIRAGVADDDFQKAYVPNVLLEQTTPLPPSLLQEFDASSLIDGNTKLTDFVGSAVGESGQVARWREIYTLLNSLSTKYTDQIYAIVDPWIGVADGATDYSPFTNLMIEMANTGEGLRITELYNEAIAQIQQEFDNLTVVASLDLAAIDAVTYAELLQIVPSLIKEASVTSPVSVIYQNAIDPTTVAGQSFLSAIVEHRNSERLKRAGLDPSISVSMPEMNQFNATLASKINIIAGDAENIKVSTVDEIVSTNTIISGLFNL